MTANRVTLRALIVSLIMALLVTPVLAQESAKRTDADSGANFHLTGVLVSGSGRSALVNNSVFREGDKIAGAEILAIREGSVQLSIGSQELTVRVGATVATDQFSGAAVSRQPPTPQLAPDRVATAATTKLPVPAAARSNSDSRYGPVMPGETLSEIAELHRAGDTTLNQMMIALFDANPHAFGGNINVLRKGTMLHIPDDASAQRKRPVAAMAEVKRQMDAWQNDRQRRTLVAGLAESERYGPVSSGETLSGIAARVSRNGATMNQTMMALFHANPQAFGGNINILHEGAVLRIPDDDELRQRAPALAAAEVVRQMEAWLADSRRPQQSARANDNANTPRQESFPPSEGVLLSMTSSE